MREFFNIQHPFLVVEYKGCLHLRRIVFLLIVLSCFTLRESRGQTQDTIKFLSYNLLNYPSAGGGYAADTTTRHPHYRTIMNDIDPDILVVQEMNSQTGVNGFLSHVLNATTNTYSAGPFIDGYDTDNGIFYKSDKFHSVTNAAINTELRDISEFKLVHTLSGDTIRVYSLHLKASSGSSNEAQRAREVDSLRKVTNALPAGSNFIVCGDFNIYGSTESAYQKLLQNTGGNEGHFIDPITMTGSWGQASYSVYHTQSPRTRAFGGGSTGGMDDRFDLILYSEALSTNGGIKYVANSQIAYGNDGNHYNDSINDPPNTAVSVAIANALHYASDHLPVKSLFTFEYNTGAPPTDFGIVAVLDPISPLCANANQSLAVRVKNFGALPVDLSVENLIVSLKITNPSAGINVFSETLSSGTIAAGAVMTVSFSSVYDMSVVGNYSFLSYTSQANDANLSNDTLPAVNISVTSSPTASVSPPGPLSICNGDSVSLMASSGISYLWSDGQTTQSIFASDTGSYSVLITLAGGCTSTSNSVQLSFISPPANGMVFYESMGTVGGTTSISSHESNNGFDNDGFTMSGSGDVRVTSASSGYTGASGGANVFITNLIDRNFIISGINTLGYTNLVLSHGIHKSATAADGTELIVEVSTNGVDYTALTATPLNTGSGTATWHYRTLSGTIPSSPTLSIQFRNTVTTSQFRIDDITLSGTSGTAGITASGSTSFCQGDSVVLSASAGNTYHWSTGATTQDITVLSSGSYFARVDCQNSDTVDVTVSNCQDVTLNLKAFIEGFYLGNQKMIAVADPVGNPGLCDTVTVQLAEAASPNNIAYTLKSVLDTNGNGSFVFPPAVINNSFYIVVKHRNALETWSSSPILFNGTSISYDFTTSAGKAYGNNLVNVDGEFCFYSGDVTDGLTDGVQDGIIDLNDFNSIENATSLFISGYSVFDLSGDRVVESSDFSLIGNNVEPFIPVMRP
jgi:endonuclease/exonuclease/phosphatase family metal-dependent hydrolase